MENRFARVLLAYVILVCILPGNQFVDGLAQADGINVPTAVRTRSEAMGTEPSGAGSVGAELPNVEPGAPNGAQSREGAATSGRRGLPTEAPQAAIPLAPTINPQIDGWPRTTAQTTLAGISDDPPVPTKWIDVDLTRQVLTAYIGATPVKSVLVSSGTMYHPTVIGTFNVWAKVPSQTMEGGSHEFGDYYNLPNVTDVMYFYEGYALHGAYWHNNFGHPMSHGCVNLTLDDAAWLYQWSPDGITVRTHL